MNFATQPSGVVNRRRAQNRGAELLDRHRFASQTEARMAVFHFIEGFYNRTRRHSAIGYISPIEMELKSA